MKIYSKKNLLDALKEAGLPHTYKSLLKYERLGVLPRNKSNIDFGVSNGSMRIYTEAQVQEMITKLKTYKDQGKLQDVA